MFYKWHYEPMPQTLEQQFSNIFSKYLRANKARVQDLVEKKAYSLAIELYRATPVADEQQIQAAVAKYGWNLVRPAQLTAKGGVFKDKTKRTKWASLEEFKAAVLRLRLNARQFVASGWIPAIDTMKARGQASGSIKLKRFKKYTGGVQIIKSGAVWKVKIWNGMPGIQKLQSQTNFVRQAVESFLADIVIYLKRKGIKDYAKQ